jgi:hypothetical protein
MKLSDSEITRLIVKLRLAGCAVICWTPDEIPPGMHPEQIESVGTFAILNEIGKKRESPD